MNKRLTDGEMVEIRELLKCPRPNYESLHLAALALLIQVDAQTERLRLLKAVVAALPRCSGEWTAGSGGHRKHENCSKIATYVDDPYYYCDEHRLKNPDDWAEFSYADALRALEAADREAGEK